jgi:hypothetical protein
MAIGADFEIQADGDIRHVSGSSTYTVLEFHRWLQGLADDAAASGDDIMDITELTPSERSTDTIITLLEPYNIDDVAAQYLYGGSISQKDGDELYSGLQVLGSVNSPTTQLRIVQNNALLTNYWGTGLNPDPTIGAILQIMVKSRTGGADIDGKRIRVQAREWGDTFDFFNVLLGLGVSVAAISTTPDAQNTTLKATVDAYTDVVNTEGFQVIDLNNGNGNREYYSKWTYGALNAKALWEWVKAVTVRATAKTIHGMNGELFLGITHSFGYDNEASGPFQEDEIISWGTGPTAGTGKLLALDDDGATGNIYMQLLTGVAPTNDLPIAGVTSGATADVNGSVTARTVPKVFLGTYTGSFIGAYGIGIDPPDLTNADTLQDLSGTNQTPPNNVNIVIAGLESGEDRVILGRNDGTGALEVDTYTLDAGNNLGNSTVVIKENILSDDPSTGVIRLYNGLSYDRYTYTSRTGKTFSGVSPTLTKNYAESDPVFVPFIDELASSGTATETIVYSAPINVVGRVRDGGVTPIKPFPISGVVGSGGFSVTAIRTSDE